MRCEWSVRYFLNYVILIKSKEQLLAKVLF